MAEKKKPIANQFILACLIAMAFAAILIFFNKHLFDSLSVFDDQRNVLKLVNAYKDAPLDRWFFSAPFYFGIFIGLNSAISNLIIVKFLFLLTIPLFFIFTYHMAGAILEKYEYKSSYLPAAITIMCFIYYLDLLLYGYPKSLSFPLLLGVVYFAAQNKKIFAFLSLFLMAFIYPPHFMIGTAFFLLYSFYEVCLNLKKAKGNLWSLLRLRSSRAIIFVLIFLAAYAAYFMIFVQSNKMDNATSRIDVPKISIDKNIKEKIDNTRTDFISSSGKYLGIIPRQYIDNPRMGLFGLIETKLALILMFPLLCMCAIRSKEFIFPRILFILFLASLILFLFAHIFYDKLYFPSRYASYTFPLIFIFLFGMNLVPSVDKIMAKFFSFRREYQLTLRLFFVLIGLLGITIYKKIIAIGNEYFNVDLINFILISFSLLIIASVLIPNPSSRHYQKHKSFLIIISYMIFACVLLIAYKGKASPPVNVYDKELFPLIESLGNNISLSGYPEIMDNIQALTSTKIKVNLGQERKHEDAYELYHFLTAYYATSLSDVYSYMTARKVDFFVVEKAYFRSAFSEDNNLFSFFPVLRRYEEKLKTENKDKFVLLNPPKEIIELETEKSDVISYKKLKNYL